MSTTSVSLPRSLVGEGNVGDGVARVLVGVVLLVGDQDGGVVAQLVAAHQLQIHLHGAAAHALVDAFVFVEGFRTRLDEVFQRPLAVAVAQAGVEGAVADEGIAVDGHEKIFSKNGKIFSAAQKGCAVGLHL
jgi:hypothetical protein